MSYAWDIITVVIILSFMLSSFRKGFINTIIRFIGLIAAFIGAGLYSEPVAKTIYGNYFKAGVIENISLSLEKMGQEGIEEFSRVIKTVIDELPAIVKAYIAPEVEGYMGDWFTRLQELGTDGFALAFAEGIVEPIMIMVLRALVFSAFFAVLMFFVNMVASLFKGIRFIPLLGSLNSILGGGLGLLQGILYVFVICTIMWLIITSTGGIENILTMEIIDDTFLLKRFFSAAPWFDGVMRQYNFSLS